jgi:hypothetical protein
LKVGALQQQTRHLQFGRDLRPWACSVGWWLMAGAGLFWEKSTVGWFWLVAGGWFVLREKYCWLVADKPSEQGACLSCYTFLPILPLTVSQSPDARTSTRSPAAATPTAPAFSRAWGGFPDPLWVAGCGRRGGRCRSGSTAQFGRRPRSRRPHRTLTAPTSSRRRPPSPLRRLPPPRPWRRRRPTSRQCGRAAGGATNRRRAPGRSCGRTCSLTSRPRCVGVSVLAWDSC